MIARPTCCDVHITGIGAVTFAGDHVRDIWASAIGGGSVDTLGQLPPGETEMMLPPHVNRMMSREARAAFSAARRVWWDARLGSFLPEKEKFRVYVAVAGNGALADEIAAVAGHIYKAGAGIFRCADSGQALYAARQDLASRKADQVLIVSYGEGAVTPSFVPSMSMCPLDRFSVGGVSAKAAAAVLLEWGGQAEKRDGVPYVRVAGAGMGSDTFPLLSLNETGSGIARGIHQALRESSNRGEWLDAVFASFDGSLDADRAHINGLVRALGEKTLTETPLTSGTPVFGVAGSSTALLHVILACLAFRNHQVPPIGGTHAPDSWAMPLRLVLREPIGVRIGRALVTCPYPYGATAFVLESPDL